MTVEDQMGAIERRLAQRARVRFREILSEAATRLEVIVTLQALLELIRWDRVDIYQERLFGPIFISTRPPEEAGPDDVPAIV
jgi:chromatin segregation and condensation protein Rec8/ScpA/Scc1 (kleisin family)